MRTFKAKILFFVVGTALVLPLQGCDQISKLINYFSPKKAASKPATVKPMEVKSVATATTNEPKAAVATTPEPAKTQIVVKPSETKATPPPDLPANVLAKVGNWTITLDEFKLQEKSAQELAKQNNLPYNLKPDRLLGMIVEQQLLFQEAQRQGLDKESKVAKQLEEARKLILSQNMQNKMVEGLNLTDEEIKEFYDQNKQFYYEPVEYKLTQIVVDTEEQANAILGQVAQGGNFAEIANAQSKIKPDGKFIPETAMPFQKFKDVVRTLEVGKFSAVFQGEKGFYIVKIDEKKGGKEKNLDEVKDLIKSDVSYLKYLQALEKLQGAIPVQTNPDLIKSMEAK